MQELLSQVLFRLGSDWADLDVLSSDEVACWPGPFLSVLQREGLLVQAPLATSVDCDACYEGHAEPVETVEEPAGTALRHYIVCPEVGRVKVDPERLRQWRLDLGGLARALVRLLLTRGQPRENAKSSLWELGNTEVCGTVHDVLLAKNGARIGDGELLQPAGTGWVNPIILVVAGDSVQAAGTVVVPLVRVLSVDLEGLVLDRRYLEAVASQGANLQPQPQYIFRKEGDYWTIGFGSPQFSLKHLKGLEYIGYLIAQSGRAVPVLELFHLGKIPTDSPHASSLRNMSQEDLTDRGLGISSLAQGDEILDPQAKQEYRQRLADLDEDILEAEANNDSGRLAMLKQEKDFLVQQLAAAVGLGGRDRRSASAHERARTSVTKSLERALGRLQNLHPELVQFLRNSIKTGTICEYRPDREIHWLL